ncbi:hypothetical protein DW721_04670 [Clostridium sp. AM27-31LB]|jgi:hypothetical protein|uniref:McrB family protein n=1 Tax=Clostridium sp. AM27-31LB TaxID=2293026 RepID=UPI000E4A288D|nr:AAA family ATPase [Clostridium sp. AM27-31LB]MEE0057067.1 AAA family ATPase [[Bacteroides] pectinophilus]RHT95057.1 hypothetical protein DW721_04670 [Clostridium sp. AM27-31LB]
MNDNNMVLQDLGELVEKTKSAVQTEFSYEDVSLSKGFRDAFAKNISAGGNTIEYLKNTAIITTSAGLKVYLPNQWFVLATYPVELIKEIIKYRNYTEKVIDDNESVFLGSNGKILEKKEIYKNLKSPDGIDFSGKFKQIMKDYLLSLGQQEDIANRNCELLYKFVSNDKWWLGGKGIERTNDFYVSPILSVLNLVNASQSYVATITYAYVNDGDLYAELATITEADREYSEASMPIVFNTKIDERLKKQYERNRILFGAPGTGKSFELKKDSKEIMDGTTGYYERITFHPDYSYSQFVGTYKPVMGDNDDIRYDFVPGPFMRVYAEALKNARTDNPQPYLLLIEEINRAKVAAVFGDVFQLLDRDDDGISEYEIQASEDIQKYLAKPEVLGGNPADYKRIRIPNNMFIWATMNSADQGVFPMDTAFKRRWNFEYLGINKNEEKISGTGKIKIAGREEPIEWNRLRKAINNKMSSDKFKVNEDKLMGPFFLSTKLIASDETGMIIDTAKFIEAFKSKVIMYLYEDAVKQGKHKFFDGCDSSKYSSVCDAFDEKGMGIFGEDFENDYYDK